MSDADLFPDARSLSPLAEWKRRNFLLTVQEEPAIVGMVSPESGELCSAFYVLKDSNIYPSQDYDKIGRGDTEESAALDFCLRNGVRSWHAEEPKP